MVKTAPRLSNFKVSTIDLLRTIAIFFVIIDHVSSWSNYYHVSDLKIYWFLQVIVKTGVPLFLMISGYFLLCPREETILKYAKKRLNRIFLPFICWSYIYLLFQYKFPLEEWQRSMPLNEITFNPILILKQPTYGHLWFMYLLIGCYISVPFLRKINKSLNFSEIVYIILILLTGQIHSFILNTTGSSLLNSSMFINFFCDYIIFFEGGYLLRILETKVKIKVWIYYIFFLLGTSMNWCVIFKTSWGTDNATLLLGGDSPFIILVAGGIWGIVRNIRCSHRIIEKLSYLSKYTFQIYFCHMIFVWICSKIYMDGRNMFQMFEGFTESIILVSIIVFICSLITSIIIDRIKTIIVKNLHYMQKW